MNKATELSRTFLDECECDGDCKACQAVTQALRRIEELESHDIIRCCDDEKRDLRRRIAYLEFWVSELEKGASDMRRGWE